MNILKDIPKLIEAGIITDEIAINIQNYYKEKKQPSNNKLFSIFAILGSVLIGLGIILIIAHNWSQLPKSLKLVIAFTPLLTAQSLCFYVLLNKNENLTWRESTAIFLILSISTCISLVSQIYHINGKLSSFLFVWLILSVPVIYFMRSSLSSLFYIFMTTVYAISSENLFVQNNHNYRYWILFSLLIPYIFYLYKKFHKINFIFFHNWLIPLALSITLGITIRHEGYRFFYMSYMSLFALFYIIGSFDYFLEKSFKSNGYRIIGNLGTMFILFILSFRDFWRGLIFSASKVKIKIFTPQGILVFFMALLVLSLLYIQKRKNILEFDIFKFIFIPFIITFLIGFSFPYLSLILINIYIFGIGIIKITAGVKKENLLTLNYGLLIMAIFTICRFFDTQISFVLRGLFFIVVGSGFFISNYYILKKKNEQN